MSKKKYPAKRKTAVKKKTVHKSASKKVTTGPKRIKKAIVKKAKTTKPTLMELPNLNAVESGVKNIILSEVKKYCKSKGIKFNSENDFIYSMHIESSPETISFIEEAARENGVAAFSEENKNNISIRRMVGTYAKPIFFIVFNPEGKSIKGISYSNEIMY